MQAKGGVFLFLIWCAACRMANFNEPPSTIKPAAEEIMLEVSKQYGSTRFRQLDSAIVEISHYWRPVFGWFSKLPSGLASIQLQTSYQDGLPDKPKIFLPSKDRNILDSLTLQTLAYFVDFPHRIQEATVIKKLENAQNEGEECYRILATWARFEPHRQHDQFLLWIDPGSHRIVRVDFTSRGTSKSQKISMKISREMEINGISYFKTMQFFSLKGKSKWREIHVLNRLQYF